MDPNLQHAVEALRRGEPVLLYDADGREEETDIVVASQHIRPEHIRRMRQDGGGLICTAIAPELHQHLGLPFADEVLSAARRRAPVLGGLVDDDIPYDSRSSFGITINHRSTFTGVTDEDRATTIRELARFADRATTLERSDAQRAFGESFRSPGHCILLNGAPGGLADRQGHTELSLQLARLAGLTPSTTICEMMDPHSGRALAKKDARSYAQAHGLPFLAGQELIDACRNPQTTPQPSPVLTYA